MKKLHFEIRTIKDRDFDGEYTHTVCLLGIEYTAGEFEYDDSYKQITIGLIFIRIKIWLQ